MIKMKTNVKPGKTPAEITVSMIDEDLNNGITKPEMAIKYGIKLWEVAEMFKHPFLKGRRPSKKKPLSFKFVDDITDAVDPNQVTLEDAITEATEEVETAVDRLADVNKAVVDMLGPTDPEQTIESLINEVKDTEEDLNPSFEKEEELEIGDDTFEL
tara:strand:+ start:185 stop:655 length:471 start_codon:yes stop_codon:yes gene_type:complete